MRSPLILIAILSLCLFSCFSTAAPGQALRRRDDPSPSPTSGGGSDGSAASTAFPLPNLASVSSALAASSSRAAQNAQNTQSPSASAGNGTSAGAAAASGTGQVSPTSSAAAGPVANNAGPPLPIQPTLNAVWIISGILLLLSGLVYTFVGIKHKQIQVFLSATYTAALGITVLIIYILTPPVSLGQQGAYLAAIIFPGFILGALSIVFKDVTEGLGCGVGGFALSMWLLTLRQGGLIQTTSAKVIFICVFTLAIFALSFSHHTRTYGLIGATSFAGATCFILGVDCLAGAGLKEFWPYIWNVNNKLFPLGTTTYPLTKGMIAEIAAIPIATLFGILSQIKIWKILQTKREKRAQEQAERDRVRDLEEERRGKDLVVQTEAEKMLWEQAYSENRREAGLHSDSGIGSEASTSEKGSVKGWPGSGKGKGQEVNVEVYEMSDLASPSNEKLSNRMTPHIVVSVAEEPEYEEAAGKASLSPIEEHKLVSSSEEEALDDQEDETVATGPLNEQETELMDSLKGLSLRPKSSVPPVIPLPFTIPSGDSTSVRGNDDDASSVATAATSVNRLSKRFSSSSLLESLTKNRLSFHKRQASDTSSVQAIADDHFDATSQHLSRTSSVTDLSHDGRPVSTAGSRDEAAVGQLPTSGSNSRSSSQPASNYVTPKNSSDMLRPPAVTKAASTASEASAVDQSEPSAFPDSRSLSEAPADNTQSHLSMSALSTEKVTKTLYTFRANEWAKHLGGASAPEDDNIPLSEPPSPTEEDSPALVETKEEALSAPAVDSTGSNSNRSSVASSSSDHQQSESGVAKATWPKHPSTRLSTSATPDAKSESRPTATRVNSQEGRSSSRMSMMRSSSNPRARNGKMRQSTQPVVTSPIQEDVEAIFVSQPKRTSTVPNSPPTLLERRESMMSQTSLSRTPSQLSVHKVPITNAMYNASRTSLMQDANRSTSRMSRRSSNPEPLDLQHQLSNTSLRSASQPYSPPPPIRTYSPMPDLGSPISMALPPMQSITHAVPVAPPDRPLHYRNHTPNDDLTTQRMAAWRNELTYDNQLRRSSTMVDIDLEYGAGASALGSQWLAQQRQSRQLEQAGKQSTGWSGNGMTSPPPMMSPTGYADPMANAMMQNQAHQDVMRRMQSKAKPR